MSSIRRSAAVAAAVVLIVLSAGLSGQPAARRPMTLVDLIGVPRVLDPQLSPDGLHLAYTLTRPDWKANRRIGHIFVQATAGGSPTQVTFGDSGEFLARWSPDGKWMSFLRDGQLYLLPVDGGEARALTRHATGISSPAWAPDGSAVYFLATDPKTTEERERERIKDDLTPFEEGLKQRHLWKIAVANGAEQRLTTGDFSVRAFRLSRDGKRIAVHRSPTMLVSDGARGEVWVMDATGEGAHAVTKNAIEENEAELSPDNSQVLFLANANAQFDPYYVSNIFIVPAEGGTARPLVTDDHLTIDHATWAPDGKSILAVVNLGVHSEIYRIDMNGAAKALTDGRHSVQQWSLTPAANRMAFLFDEPTRIGDAWTLAVSGGEPARVTGMYNSLDADFALPRQEKVAWKGADGVAIEGVLFYPVGYQAGKRYPLVVQLHGGPEESDKFGFGPSVINDYVQVLAAKGYAVLKPNYRGSTGYGNAFFRDVVGGYFKNMHLDVLAGVDQLIKDGIADPDRLAVSGWSAGGHLTNKLITFTDRFKAASAGASAADWTSMFAQTDTRANRIPWFGGTPWQKDAPIDVYWNSSPLKDVAKVKTPTLFFVGDEDERVPKAQSIEMYRALAANGVATKLYVAAREGHQWGELRHQLSKANAELEWFERYVMGRSYTAEQPPDAEGKTKTQ